MNKILSLIKEEKHRQAETLMMIPSENYTYPEIRQAVGSVLMHKYAEGLPQKRYYQGNSIIDEIELICQTEALKSFSLSSKNWSVNVQSLSGAPANIAAYNALLSPGEKIMSMYLPDGGHLSHGWEYKGKKLTLVSKIWNVEFYKVDPKSQVFNYSQIEIQAKKFRPKLLISGGTAYPREINHAKMGRIAKSVNAYYLADVSHEAGLIAAGVNKSPFGYADVVTMTTHKTLRGPRGALIFAKGTLINQINASVFPGMQGGPHMHTIAGIAIALQKAQSPAFKKYAHQVVKNAKVLAAELIKFDFKVISGGTDKHLILVDLRNKKTNGWFVALALEYAGIVVNRNTIPADTASPYYPSGIRLGTPAITTQGMKEDEMKQIASWINEVVNHIGPGQIPVDKEKRDKTLKTFKSKIAKDKFLLDINKQVKSLCNRFPTP
jgi:glycine hydroxymethyltransferase